MDYISALLSKPSTKDLGLLLLDYYNSLMKTLTTEQLALLLSTIERNHEKIGRPQYFGKFRAFLFEEYIMKRIINHLNTQKNIVFEWEPCIEISKDYCIEVDILASQILPDNSTKYLLGIECKVELDASRLKEALANLILIKAKYPHILAFIVFFKKDVSERLIDIALKYIDGIVEVSHKNDELDLIIKRLHNLLETF